jgi:hypothetical protein
MEYAISAISTPTISGDFPKCSFCPRRGEGSDEAHRQQPRFEAVGRVRKWLQVRMVR